MYEYICASTRMSIFCMAVAGSSQLWDALRASLENVFVTCVFDGKRSANEVGAERRVSVAPCNSLSRYLNDTCIHT